jgi:hypothetical protein
MELIVISAIFIAIVCGGVALAAVLVVRAIRADAADLDAAEQSSTDPVSEPRWVHP